MNCTLVIKIAATLAAATEVVLRHSGSIVGSARGMLKPAFPWNGLASVMQFFCGDELNTHDVPDISEELESIQTKFSKLGKVRVILELEPRVEPKE